MRLLMIDDDELLADAIAQHLIQQHYAVDIATTGQMGLEFIELFSYDLIILDLMLPDLNGRSLCTRIRQNKHQMPILMLTAQDAAEEKIQGLDAGADDYLVKPIHLPELLARVRALLRRSAPTATPQLQWGALALDPSSFETTFEGQLLNLTPKEYAILELFLRHPHNSQTLDGIIDNIWALEDTPSLYAVRTHIKSLRQKLKALGAPQDWIETLYGFGYRLNPEYQDSPVEPGPTVLNPIPVIETDASLSAQMNKITQALWVKHKDEMEARIVQLDVVVKALDAHSLTTAIKQQGVSAAHKLAGSLGCYGFLDGSQIAQAIEHRLLATQAPEAGDLKRLVQQLRHSLQPSSVEHESNRMVQTPAIAQEILDAAQPLCDSGSARAKVLIVDDDSALLSLLDHNLGSLGFDIVTLDDTLNFWSTLKQADPDVVILDVEMPKVNGLELCKRLRADAHWSHLPVIFLSSHQDAQTEDCAFVVGADDFIHKSFPMNRLALRIQNRVR